ncbi:LOW QUALITY PROTEIN: ribosomal RNA processing protein 36 homolog [Stegostoma tigrinum]|uniref:LOW QUALITY PROTEIN: ribosomal RNA processing protein 36 homolog n=1 Tax=Stegostoma tigrinum TaxID=3053191 RepID=UPI0028704B47|nr:LOW QUALITY PROTEIN: ribosomal RNA processing protein 36 homolog [Stegostoma tigrinum]
MGEPSTSVKEKVQCWGVLLFAVYVNDPDINVRVMITKFTDQMKNDGFVNSEEDKFSLQDDKDGAGLCSFEHRTLTGALTEVHETLPGIGKVNQKILFSFVQRSLTNKELEVYSGLLIHRFLGGQGWFRGRGVWFGGGRRTGWPGFGGHAVGVRGDEAALCCDCGLCDRVTVPVLQVRRDPRFDDLSGQFKPEIYEKTYAFLSQLRNKEKEVIKKKLHQVKDPDQRTCMLKGLLQRMTQQDEAESKKRKQRERLLEFKRKQRERVQQGSRPYFLKKSEQRKLDLAEKYVELKKTGQLERFLGKKRRRNAQKDRSRLPGKKSQ